MTFERKALTSFLLALCLALPERLPAAPETARDGAAEKPAEATPKGKEEAPAKDKEETPAKPGDEKPAAEEKPGKPAGDAPAKPMPAEDENDEAAAERKELFERDGKKWVRFIVTDPGEKNSPRNRIEAPLVRIALIKEPGGKSEAREVVRLNFTIGERKLRADFTLNNRSNMLSPVLIGRSTIKEIGWVDPSRAYLADQKIMR